MFKFKYFLLLALSFCVLGNVQANYKYSDKDREVLKEIIKYFFTIGGMTLTTGSGAAVIIEGVVKYYQASEAETFYSDYDEYGNLLANASPRRLIDDIEEHELHRKELQRKALEVLGYGLATAVPNLVNSKLFWDYLINEGKGEKRERAIFTYVATSVLSVLGSMVTAIVGGSLWLKNKKQAAVGEKLYVNYDLAGNKLEKGQKRLVTNPKEYLAIRQQRARKFGYIGKLGLTALGSSAIVPATILMGKLIPELTYPRIR